MDNTERFYEIGKFNYFTFIISIIFFIGVIIGSLSMINPVSIIVFLVALIFLISELRLYFKNKPIIITNDDGLFIDKIKKNIKWNEIKNIRLIPKRINVTRGINRGNFPKALLWLVINSKPNNSIKIFLGEINISQNKKKIEKLKKILQEKRVKIEDFDVSYENLKKIKLNLFSSPSEYDKFFELNNN